MAGAGSGAGRRPTRQEVNRRREGAQFVGRRGELAVFRETFARNPEEPDFPFLFHVRGNGGVGKSTLVRQWEGAARERPSVVTAYVDDDVHDVFEAMEAVSARLGRQGHPLKRFDKQLAAYRQRRHQAESVVPAPQPELQGGREASPAGTVAAQVGLVGLGMVPGVGAFVGAVDPQQVALGADRLRAALNMRLRSHDDVQLVMNPVAVLAPVFLDDLAEVAERCERVVLFFDVYERTGPVLDGWLHDIVFGEEYGGLPVNVQIVLSGQLRLDSRVWGDRLGQVTDVSLEVFTEEEARTLLATHGVTDEPSVELVLRLSGRLPLLVDMLARSDPGTGAGRGDPSETAVERFLKWEQDAERREAALACALPLQIDEDIYRAIVPEAAAGSYAWLRGLAFVSPQEGRCRYHDVVRAAMLRLQRTRSPARWQRAHIRLADLFRRGRTELEADIRADPDDRWLDAAWREHQLNETYHRLCANPRTGLPEALRQCAYAIDLDVATLRRWAQILGRAGADTDSADLISWGSRLDSAAEQERPGEAVLTLLLSAAELDADGRALVHALRAAERRGGGDGEGSLADGVRAVSLAPDTALTHAALGETYRNLGRHEEAVASCTRALELDPGYVIAYGSRGDAYRNLGRHDEGIADFDRAVELDPQYAWAYASRAQVYEAMGRRQDALADYDRAIGVDPLYEWAIGSRAQLFERMGRFDEALADFDRAVELDPQYAWAYGSRARTYEAMGRRQDALADYARAVELDPQYAWAHAGGAQVLAELGRFEEALSGFARAVELDPRYAWAFGSRARLHDTMGNHEEALADYTRAIDISPGFNWAIGGRAELYGRLGRHEEALVDITRAIESDPSADWLLNVRARTYLRLGRYDEAVADCVRAVEIDPEDGWNQMLHGVALRAAGDGQGAEECFARALSLFTGAGEEEALLVLSCAMLDADQAAARCEALVGLAPGRGVIAETIEDLMFLPGAVPEAGPCVDAAVSRLREAL
ncbi:tetratricopeptide repeat protein [Streptomyces sp. NBC_01012]|uniref:tetratricopeptide repeat protein n=1 Tax=Streptomyces sp. NBC_01012 TaxID=2903717 RepID=UPI00386DC729|nr:tetratricopeptide repeat protein [Streptomyces sp. NBC_01012]